MKAQSRAAAQIKALARRHTRAAIKVLAAIMNQSDGPATARVSAAQALLDRGWGKAAQPVAGEEGGLAVIARIERVILTPDRNTLLEFGVRNRAYFVEPVWQRPDTTNARDYSKWKPTGRDR